MTAEHGPGYLAVLPQAQASAKAGCGRGPIGVRRCGKASEVDGLFVAGGAASYASAIQHPAAVPDGPSRRGDIAEDGRRGGILPGRAGGQPSYRGISARRIWSRRSTVLLPRTTFGGLDLGRRA